MVCGGGGGGGGGVCMWGGGGRDRGKERGIGDEPMQPTEHALPPARAKSDRALHTCWVDKVKDGDEGHPELRVRHLPLSSFLLCRFDSQALLQINSPVRRCARSLHEK